MSYFFEKKNLLQFAFETNNLLCKKREKITCHEEKSQPPWISNGPSLREDALLSLDSKVKDLGHRWGLFTNLFLGDHFNKNQ